MCTRLRRWPSLSAVTVRDTWLGHLGAASVGMGLSTGTVQDNVDAIVVWDPASRAADETSHIDDASPIAAELRRRQALAATTVPFRGGRIRFESSTAALTPESDAALRIVLAELQRDPGLTLVVKAFTDAREPDGDRLSLERARAVVAWLTSRGIAPAAPAGHRLRVDARAVVRTNRGGACRQSAGGTRARLAAGSLRPAVLVRFPVAVTGLDTVALVWMGQHSATDRYLTGAARLVGDQMGRDQRVSLTSQFRKTSKSGGVRTGMASKK